MPKSEEQRRADKAAYMRRKRAEQHAQLTLGDKCLLDRQLQTPTEEQREKMASQIAQANGIVITEKDNIQDLERRFQEASRRAPSRIIPTSREQAQAVIADAEERSRRVQLIMSQYQKDACNQNALLWHLLETLTLMRLELTDLIGSLRK